MAALYSEDHPGTLVVECRGEITVEIDGVPKAEAQTVLADLAARRTTNLEARSGSLYVVDGLSVIAAHWSPDR